MGKPHRRPASASAAAAARAKPLPNSLGHRLFLAAASIILPAIAAHLYLNVDSCRTAGGLTATLCELLDRGPPSGSKLSRPLAPTMPTTVATSNQDHGDDGARMLDAVFASLPTCDVQADGDAAFDRAGVHKREGRVQAALACHRRAIELQPTHPGAYNNFANTVKHASQIGLGCGDGKCTPTQLRGVSVHALRTVIGLNPRHANAYVNLASLMRADYRFDEAIALGRTAVRIEPRHVTGYENLGRALQAHSAPATLPSAAAL